MTDNKLCNLRIYCIKPDCKFEQDWDSITLEEAKKYYEEWNKNNSHLMACIHHYEFAERVK